MNYWIGVVSKEHVQRGIALGIVQISHGRRSALARLKAGDGFIYYSSKERMSDTMPLQAFTAIGIVADDDIWQVDEGDFKPWRRYIRYAKSVDTSIRPLLDELSFTRGRVNWGYMLRFGLIKITKEDFDIIAEAMKAQLPVE